MNGKNPLKFHIWLSIVSAVVIFVVLINANRTYKSEVDILIISKNEAVSRNIDKIINDVKEIPKSLSFYDQIFSSGDDMYDEAGELPGYKRKDYWESKIKTKRIDDSSMVKIVIFDKNQARAEDLSQQAGLEIARVMSQYYNIKTELEIRIADGPVVSYGFEKNIIVLIAESVFWGILSSLIALFSNNFLEKTNLGGKVRKIRFSTRIKKIHGMSPKIEELPITFSRKPSGLEKKQPEMEIAALKKSSAPDNLPVGELPRFTSKDIQKKEETKEEARSEPIIREATQEEVKERLNKLLRGEL